MVPARVRRSSDRHEPGVKSRHERAHAPAFRSPAPGAAGAQSGLVSPAGRAPHQCAADLAARGLLQRRAGPKLPRSQTLPAQCSRCDPPCAGRQHRELPADLGHGTDPASDRRRRPDPERRRGVAAPAPDHRPDARAARPSHARPARGRRRAGGDRAPRRRRLATRGPPRRDAVPRPRGRGALDVLPRDAPLWSGAAADDLRTSRPASGGLTFST